MNTLRLFVIFPVCLVLSACGASFPVKPDADPGKTSKAVKDAIDKGAVVEQSVMRNDDKIFLSVRLPSARKDSRGGSEIYLQADCSNESAKWIYADLVGEKEAPTKKTRLYAGGATTYSPPLALDESAAKAIHKLPEVKRACEHASGWREVIYNKRTDTQILLDIQSLKTQDDGNVNFWAGIDYPYLAYIRLLKAPYARKAGFYQANCRKQLYSLLYIYYLDGQGTVTDGGMAARPPVLNIDQAPDDVAAALEMVCDDREAMKTLLPPAPRAKKFPDFSAPAAPDTGIVSQIAQSKRPPPRQTFGSLRIEGTKIAKGNSMAARLSGKEGFFVQKISIDATGTPGIFRVAYQEGDEKRIEASFLGIIPLSQTLITADAQNISVVDKLELRGDWSKMPINSQLGYWMRLRVIDAMTNQFNKETEVICKVARDFMAESLNPKLQGNAKELKCHTIGDRDDEIATYYYLENYDFAFQQGSTSVTLSRDSRVAEVR